MTIFRVVRRTVIFLTAGTFTETFRLMEKGGAEWDFCKLDGSRNCT